MRGKSSPASRVGGAAGPSPPPHPRQQCQGSVSICVGKERPLCAAQHVQSEGAEAVTHSPPQEQLSRGLGGGCGLSQRGPGASPVGPARFWQDHPIPTEGTDSAAPGEGAVSAPGARSWATRACTCAERGRVALGSARGRRARAHASAVGQGSARREHCPFDHALRPDSWQRVGDTALLE